MAGYKYRVYDGNTGKEFADVATLKLALDILPALREFYPQVTIDEIVPERVREDDKLVPGDRVVYVGGFTGYVGKFGTVDDRYVGEGYVGVTWGDDDRSGERVIDLRRSY